MGDQGGSLTSKRMSRRRRRATGTNNAPFNSTQFLMNDHVSEAVKHLNSTLNVKAKPIEAVDESSIDSSLLEQRPVRRITRARESSFSIDSDEDYYYSSPEDEEEFLSKEFIKDYDNVRNDRLIDMSKAELINEYLQMEDKIEALEKRLSRQSSQTEQIQVENTVKEEDSSKKAMEDIIQKFQNEIKRLESENDKLKLVQAVKIPFGPGGGLPPGTCSTSCSSCSESDSESDSNSDSDDTSDSEDSEN